MLLLDIYLQSCCYNLNKKVVLKLFFASGKFLSERESGGIDNQKKKKEQKKANTYADIHLCRLVHLNK
jgi:hypothetical protein